MRSYVALATLALALAPVAVCAAPALVPAPQSIRSAPCALSLAAPLRLAGPLDAGGLELLRERWAGLGIARPATASRAAATITARRSAGLGDGYTIVIRPNGVVIEAASGEGEFDALATLAQLPERDGGWHVGCTSIADAPAMRWRVLSDDVSRGPFPTMDYARRRIRTLAALKYNGWSPYMENVVVDPRAPFIASPNGWTAQQLHELSVYARRFHVTLIPEQQTFSHMHETLKWEQYASAAELPHGYLLAESDPATYAYLGPLLREVLAATAPTPFFHLGSDEPLDLGRGRTPRSAQTVAGHVTQAAAFLAGSGARPMIWDDAVQQDHAILGLLPKNTVIVTWHYGAEPTFRPYIDTIANAGFDQFVAPGASNWTELYPDLGNAYANIGRLVADGKGTRGVLGMFATVWHDDGETLYEATWPPVAYAAASAWQRGAVDDATWHATFARSFFGTDDPRYARALDALRAIRTLLATKPADPIDYTFWHDPFDPRLQARAASLDLATIRLRAESVMTDLWNARPPLHAQAVAAMELGALRYDQLARRLQIGREARDYYDDARAHATAPGQGQVYRSLGVAKYLCWELRNGVADIEPLHEKLWLAESTPIGFEHVRARYRIAEDDAQRCADRIDTVMREDYLRGNAVPPWDQVMSSAR